MELNGDKCYLLFARHKDQSILAKILVEKIWESYKQKLLGVQMINNNPLMSTFQIYVKRLVENYLFWQGCHETETRISVKTLVEAQFGYCPSVWMC